MKTRVRVTLEAETTVEIEVEHGADEDPTDLTKDDKIRAQDKAPAFAQWEVIDAEEITQ